MYLRCPWSLGVAIGMTLVFAITITIKAAAHNLGSSMITTSITVATVGAWLWWGNRYNATRKNEDRVDTEIDDLIHRFKSQ